MSCSYLLLTLYHIKEKLPSALKPHYKLVRSRTKWFQQRDTINPFVDAVLPSVYISQDQLQMSEDNFSFLVTSLSCAKVNNTTLLMVTIYYRSTEI